MSVFSRRLTKASSFTALLSLLAVAPQLHAQAVERNLPPAAKPQATPIAPANAVAAEQDATPIGPNLRAIVLLAPDDAVHATASDGVDLTGSQRLATGSTRAAEAQKALQSYIGQPLSRKVIAQIEASIAALYRKSGYPFVSISTPEQDITSGALQIRVIEFTVGAITPQGANRQDAARIVQQVRTQSGDHINAVKLGDDLSWLNRYPFRHVSAVFKPGNTLGLSDLVLPTSEVKPWQVYAGYNNAGSTTTSLDRYFLGGVAGGLLGSDSVLSYQFTGSHDGLFYKDRLFASAKRPLYQSQALTLTKPLGHNGQIEASLDEVTSTQVVEPFAVTSITWEGALGYRFALSNLNIGNGDSDARFGIAAKHQEGQTRYNDVNVYDVPLEIYQLYLGYGRVHEDGDGRSHLDLAAHISPGNWDRGNGVAQTVLYSQGRMKNAHYSYVTVNYDRTTRLPMQLNWNSQLIGQIGTGALPRTEQAGLGGAGLVRGYSLDDGAYDNALVLRNAIQAQEWNTGVASVTPYVFADVGYGKDLYTKTSKTLVSTGLGAKLQLTRHADFNVDAAYTLKDGPATKASHLKVEARVTVSY